MNEALPQNPYETLGVPQDANYPTIRNAFHKLALSCHPDRVKDKSAKAQRLQQLQQLQKANEVLCDENKSQRCDEEIRLAQLGAEKVENQGSLSLPQPPIYEKLPKFETRGYPPGYQPQQQHTSGHVHTDVYRPFRPPPFLTRTTSSNSSCDSGSVSKNPSVASSKSPHSYQINGKADAKRVRELPGGACESCRRKRTICTHRIPENMLTESKDKFTLNYSIGTEPLTTDYHPKDTDQTRDRLPSISPLPWNIFSRTTQFGANFEPHQPLHAPFEDPANPIESIEPLNSMVSKFNKIPERPDSISSPDWIFDPPYLRRTDLETDNALLITSKVVDQLSCWGSKASLDLQWDLLTFMDSQFIGNKDTNLASVITISGTAQYAQATTCIEYAKRNWPSQGSNLINAFQSAIDNHEHTCKVSNSNLEIVIDLQSEACTLIVKSQNPRIVAEIFEQAIWMGSAIRTSSNERVQYSSFCLRAIYPRYSVTFDTCVIVKEEEICWLPLFANAVIAQGFPVPDRENGELGLEVPLEIMAALGGARHATEFQGGLLLKGHSAIFVPVKRHSQSVQWHMIRRNDEQRVFYRDVGKECPTRAMLGEVDHESLENTRAFLGWWRSAETHLGTADAAYESIDWSPARETGRSAKISGVNLGFQNMLTGQLNFSLGAKDGRLHFSQKGPFQRIVQCAEKAPVVLYDTEDRRASFVPCLDLMLDVIKTRHHLSPFQVDGKIVELTPAIPKNGRAAAAEAVAANQQRQLYEREGATEKIYYYQDAILDIWSQIERLMEKEDSIEACAGLALHGTMQSKLHGWEYMSLVHEKNYRRKEATVLKSSGGWVDLINDVDCLVLFATGLGEIIRPVSDLGNLCPAWSTLPKGKDFLAAGVPILELLYSEAGSRLSRKHLSTSHLQWHRGSTLFERCRDPRSNRCNCDRTQQVYHDSLFKTFGHVRPPGKLEENGCVIFGQAHHSMKPTTKPSAKPSPLYTLSNNHIQNPTVSGSSSMQEDCVIKSDSDSHSDPPNNENDRTRTPSPDKVPLPLRGSTDCIPGELVRPKTKCHRMLHSKNANVDRSRDLDEAMEDWPSPALLQHGARQGTGTPLLDANGVVVKTERNRRLTYSPDHGRMPIPKTNGITGPREPCQHLNGCSCKSRFMTTLGTR